MGLFNNNVGDEEKIIQAYNKVAGVSMVDCKVAVGTHGADEIIAGAMMGETGKLIGMANYGKPKYERSVLEFHINGIVFTNPGWSIMYHDLTSFNITDRFRHADVVIRLSDGGQIVCEMLKYEAYAARRRIKELKADYMERVAKEEAEKQEELDNQEMDKNIDRVLRAGELHDRGLLSDEEFEDIKNKFLKQKEAHDTTDDGSGEEVINFCPACGAEVESNYRFCTNCGHEL